MPQKVYTNNPLAPVVENPQLHRKWRVKQTNFDGDMDEISEIMGQSKCSNSCKLCGRKFNRRGNLKRHLTLHFVDRPHKCQVCSKTYRTMCNLKSHMRTHMTPKSLHCRYCGKLYRKTKFLAKHEEFHVNSGDVMAVEFVKLFRQETAKHEQGKKQNIKLLNSLGRRKKKKKLVSTEGLDLKKEQIVDTEPNVDELSPRLSLFDDLEVEADEIVDQGFKIQTVPTLDEDDDSKEWKGPCNESKKGEKAPIEDTPHVMSQSETPYIVPENISYAETTSVKNGDRIFPHARSGETLPTPNRPFTLNTNKPVQVYGNPEAQMPVFMSPYFSMCVNVYGSPQLMGFQQQIMNCTQQIADLEQQHAAELQRDGVLNFRHGDT